MLSHSAFGPNRHQGLPCPLVSFASLYKEAPKKIRREECETDVYVSGSLLLRLSQATLTMAHFLSMYTSLGAAPSLLSAIVGMVRVLFLEPFGFYGHPTNIFVNDFFFDHLRIILIWVCHLFFRWNIHLHSFIACFYYETPLELAYFLVFFFTTF